METKTIQRITKSLLSIWDDNKDKSIFRCGIYTLVFCVTYFIAFSPFWRNGISYVLSFDGRDQSYPWLAYVGIWIRRIAENFAHGDFTVPLYDLSIGWGDGTLSYLASNGLTDPFLAFLSALVPSRFTEALYNALPIVYMYFSGLSFLYMCRYFQKDYVPSLIGSLIYVFNAFTVYYALAFNAAVNFMIFLPLLIPGVERILKKERSTGFIFTVFLTVICGSYYRLYILTILIAIYALVRLLALYPNKQWIRVFPSVFIKGAGFYLLGIGLSAVFLFPGLAVFFGSTRTGSTRLVISHDFATHWEYFWARFLSLIAPKTRYDWDWGLDFPSYAAIFFPAVIILFSSKGRKSLKWLTGIALFMLFCPVFGWIMNGFQYVCNRWSFALALLAGYIVVDVFPELMSMSRIHRITCGGALVFYAVAAFFFADMRSMVFTAVGVSFFALTLLFLNSVGRKEANSRVKKPLCLMLVIFNVCVNVIYMSSPESMDWSSWFMPTGDSTLYAALAVEGDACQYPDGDDRYEGRFDSTLLHYNDSMFYGIPGTAFYSSTINNNVSDFRKQLELCGNVQDFKSYSTDQRTIVNTLLSVKYQFEDPVNSSYLPYGYEPLIGTITGRVGYENSYALPWGYTYDNTVSYRSLEGLNGVEKANVLIRAAAVDDTVVGSDSDTIQFDIKRVKYSAKCFDCAWENGVLTTNTENARIILDAELNAGKEYYIRLKGLTIDGFGGSAFTTALDASFNIHAVCGDVNKNGRVMAENYPWYYGREDYLFCLGYSEEDRNQVEVMIPAVGEFKLEGIELYEVPLDQYPALVEKLRAEPLEEIVISDNTITGTVDLSKEKLLCLTIPYDGGWTAYVDGQKQDILKVNYAFMGLRLPEGHHEIEFRYFTPGLKAGIYVSLISLVVLLCFMTVSKKKGKKQRR